MITVNDLRVDYDTVCAVKDLSFEVGSGEVFGLIGPNGAGKTTTMRAMVGLLEPTYGQVFVDGKALDLHREEVVQTIGFMPDIAPLYEDLTVYEYLDLWAASYHLPVNERKEVIRQNLKRVDLLEKHDAFCGTLSRGMRQRLILAKTLIPDPDVLILDEPASGVDPHGRALLKDILREQGAAGKTVLISSHILSELSEFCTSIGIMELGSMVVAGRVDEIARQVLGAQEIRMVILSDPEMARQLLTGNEQITNLSVAENELRFIFNGTEEQTADLLNQLLLAGIRIISFAPEKQDLEAVFMKVGAREVS